MPNYQDTPLLLEWTTLQNQFDAFEKLSLLIKLFAIGITSLLMFAVKHPEIILLVNTILWIQDAVWKTFQSRFYERLLVIEAAMKNNSQPDYISFNTSWADSRGGPLGLAFEYVRHLLKPTVIFPHICLLAIAAYLIFV